jgi:hypothetical protein
LDVVAGTGGKLVFDAAREHFQRMASQIVNMTWRQQVVLAVTGTPC